MLTETTHMQTLSRRLLPVFAAAMMVLSSAAARAQQVNWVTDHDRAIADARANDRLLVIFFSWDEERRERDDRNRSDKMREGVREAFKDPEIRKLVDQAFICVQADFKQDKKLLAAMKGKPGRNDLVIVTPQGESLGSINVTGAPTKQAVAEKIRGPIKVALTQARDQLVTRIYDKEVRQVLSDLASKPAELKAALNIAKKLRTDSTEAEVIAVLAREKLDNGVRQLAYDVLVELSTPGAVKEMMKQAATVPAAEKMINKFDRKALPTLMEFLKGDASEEFLRAYYAVVSIARLQATSKPKTWWSEQDAAARSAEVQRIRGIIEKKER